MKRRITGRVNGDFYEVVGIDGNVTLRLPLIEARQDAKLAEAIRRNGWEKVDG